MGTKRSLAAIIALCTSIIYLQSSRAADRYVDDSHTSGTRDGTEWQYAFQYLQDAIDVASSGDTIHVAQGNYYPDLDGGFNAPAHTLGSRTESLALKPGVIMLGGYIGYNDASPNTRDPDLYPTILSGDIGTTSVATDNSYHVVTATNATAFPVTILDGFTIRDGFAEDNTSNRRGAGILISGAGSSPQFINCIIRDNFARRTTSPSTGSGGGVYSSATGIGSTIRFTNCDFLNNETGQFGGAAYIASAETVEFTACDFIGNLTSAGSGSSVAGGGAIYIIGTSSQAAELNGCFLQNNSTLEGNGGGAFANGGIILTVRHSDFVGNTSNGGGAAEGQGGGLCVYVPNSVKLVDCDFIDNQSNQSQFYSGGGVAVIGSHLSDDYTATIINCRFLGNTTNIANNSGYGGGLVVFKANLNCVNSIFAGNIAERSSGADTSDPDTVYVNCTVAHNIAIASNTVGGLQLGGNDNIVHNCILYGNTSDGVGGTNAQISSSVTPNVTYSCVEGGYTGTGNISDDPMFVGPTTGDVTMRNYRLQPCSPASDSADDTVVPADSEDVVRKGVRMI